MNEAEFWQLIETAKNKAGDDIDSRPEILQEHLSSLEPEDIQLFQQKYDQLQAEANSWSLWGAAYLMNGGCSDDGFSYFRDWLISEGEEIFKTAIANPDSLAALEQREYFELESFGYAAMEAYEEKTGDELDRDLSAGLENPTREEWEEQDLPGLLPALAAKYA